ncbi:glycosyltransferase family 2 protein [Zobellia galactanivorans]|uniref:glycosyltransferase family 2 protein n=1 Tax=Zobellia galactanivorans (strain DSM 12802 / CCUG 47099 / CIP 106680 / NCIMB 13871 / Dsij) TaxID=63186 RepID=UPI001C078D41|nr:glycosyltransferase family 2 protein [Zobellia galactanivorans]MBU3027759.1 glycosyltransferase [Zobellia galactanivorans]
MHYYVIVPAHNEEGFLADTLNSILRQSLQPKRVVVVNDNSTDNTEVIIDQFRALSPIFTKLNTLSSTEHMPGSKVINAFDKGLQLLDKDYEFIVKLDADLILPDNYFEKIAYIFRGQPKVGIAGGFIYEQDETREWKLNHPMDKNHVRGAFKAYTNKCFKAIDGLRNAMGWDTVDELLAQYHGFEIYTDDTLKVKHLRPTGNAYNQKAKLLQGKAMYTMRYGLLITVIASLKMAFKQRKPQAFSDNLYGYLEAKKENTPFLVSKSEGQFIRHLRWKNIKNKLF